MIRVLQVIGFSLCHGDGWGQKRKAGFSFPLRIPCLSFSGGHMQRIRWQQNARKLGRQATEDIPFGTRPLDDDGDDETDVSNSHSPGSESLVLDVGGGGCGQSSVPRVEPTRSGHLPADNSRLAAVGLHVIAPACRLLDGGVALEPMTTPARASFPGLRPCERSDVGPPPLTSSIPCATHPHPCLACLPALRLISCEFLRRFVLSFTSPDTAHARGLQTYCLFIILISCPCPAFSPLLPAPASVSFVRL